MNSTCRRYFFLISLLLISIAFILTSAIASESYSQSQEAKVTEMLKLAYPDYPWDSNVPTYEEQEQLLQELSQLQELTIPQRNDTITKLIDTISDPNNKYFNKNAVKIAMDISGRIRAIETTEVLLDTIDIWVRMPTISTVKPERAVLFYPAVNALIRIAPSHEIVLNKIKEVEHVVKRRCYVSVLIGTEGVDVTRYILEEAVESEIDTQQLRRLKAALSLLNEEYPESEDS